MQIDSDVLNVLGNAEMEGNSFRLVGQLDRKLYLRVNDVLEAAGGKWNRKAKAHLFEGNAADVMDEIILTGSVERMKSDNQIYGYFPTPVDVARRVIELADIRRGMWVLEPSAGRGALAKMIPSDAIVDCNELQQTNCNELESMGFNRVTCGDFLTMEPREVYDRVVMNPPFAKQADIRHVLHALKFLKGGGVLVSVMSASVRWRDNKLATQFRDLIDGRDGEIEDVPDGAFKESGTMVRTVIVTIPAA